MDGPGSLERLPPSGVPEDEAELLDLLAATPMVYRRPRRGDLIEGVVVSVGRDGLVVDIGTKTEAVVPLSEIGTFEAGPLPTVQAGETIVARVLDPEDEEGRTVLSLARAQAERGWRALQIAFAEGSTVQGQAVEANKGGLVVGVQGIRGFIPLSQLVGSWHGGSSEESVQPQLEARKGELVTLKILELNRRRNRLILSERAAEHEKRVRERDRLLSELQEGEIRRGQVTSVCDFGAFVDLGGADGLVHISELSWAPVHHPSEVVRTGDEVEVCVLGVDRERKKISLSLKRIQPEPWETVTERYQVGQIVQARIKKLAAFGAFVEIEPGIEGLIHISELSDRRIQHPKDVVEEGEVLAAKILRIEPERRRLGLSLRQALEEVEAQTWQGAPVSYGGGADTVAELLGAGAVGLQLLAESEVGPDAGEPLAEPEEGPASAAAVPGAGPS